MQKLLNLQFVSLLFLFCLATGCKQNTKKTLSESTENVTSKIPVIMVHSVWLGGWQWKGVTPYMSKEKLSVLTPDLPGHGQDKTAANQITMDDYVNSLIHLIDLQKEA